MRAKPKKTSGCRKYIQSLFLVIGFGLLFLVAGSYFFWRALTTPYKGYAEPTVRVEVRKGASTAAILRQLRSSGVLRDDFVPLVFLKTLRRGDPLKAGIYEFTGTMNPVSVIEKLVSGDVILKTVTIREGLDRFAIGALMAAEGFGTEEQWLEETSKGDLVHDLDPRAETLEGFLFPDTYSLTPGTLPNAIVTMMVQNFRKNFGSEIALIGSGLDVHDTVTLVSIVETEAKLERERPLIASVYLNRTRKSMPLQADPTVIYALKLAKRWDGNIRKNDLQIDSPYNTYKARGFPPGPIANPGLASLRAAANPATSESLYFVSKNDGSHLFSTTLEEHNRNVNLHQRKRSK